MVQSNEGVHAAGDPDTTISSSSALAHLTALSGLTRLTHLDLGLGGPPGEEAPAAELLAALPRAPLETVRRAGSDIASCCSMLLMPFCLFLHHQVLERPAARCHAAP